MYSNTTLSPQMAAWATGCLWHDARASLHCLLYTDHDCRRRLCACELACPAGRRSIAPPLRSERTGNIRPATSITIIICSPSELTSKRRVWHRKHHVRLHQRPAHNIVISTCAMVLGEACWMRKSAHVVARMKQVVISQLRRRQRPRPHAR